MSEDTDIVIASGSRTPIGAFNGGFADLPSHLLGSAVITETLNRAGVNSNDVSEVILGQVLTAGGGMNPARQASMAAGIPKERTAYIVNQVCGSGLRAVALGVQAIKAGDSSIVVAGLSSIISATRLSMPCSVSSLDRVRSPVFRSNPGIKLLRPS